MENLIANNDFRIKLEFGGYHLNLKNCKRCGKLFNFHDHNVCPACIGKDEEDFQKIRDYMREHPGVSTLELSQKTGVEPATITRFLREGRLATEEATAETSSGLLCESCGIPIYQGRYCKKCVNKLRSELKQAARDLKQRDDIKVHGKIHSLDSYRKRR